MDQGMPAEWDIPDALRRRFGKQVGRQRARAHDGHMVLLVHGMPEVGQLERQARFFWRRPDGEWISDRGGNGTVALAKHLEQFETRSEEFERREHACASATDYFLLLEELLPFVRTSKNLQSALQDARDLMPDDERLVDMRDTAYAISRTAELTYQAGNDALNYTTARQAELDAIASQRMAESAHRLNVLAAFFLPLATISGLLGVNLPIGIEGVKSPALFYAVLLLGIGLGWLVYYLVVRVPEPPESKANPES